FRCYNGRLALFHEVGNSVKYWREYWSDEKRAELTKQAKLGELYDYDAPVRKYVPKELPVLEAGCGPGHMVAALVARGYKAIGVDFEPEVVRFVNKMWPLLNVVEGDVRRLDVADGSIGCYLSGGVVEHFPEGPAAALREARRVLHPKGVALIQVPYLNPGRAKLLQRLT